MFEELERYQFIHDENGINQSIKTPIPEIASKYFVEVNMKDRSVEIKKSFQSRNGFYQFPKLRILKFYYNFFDEYIDKRDPELI